MNDLNNLMDILFPCIDDISLPSTKQADAAAFPPGSVGWVPRFEPIGRGPLEDEDLFERGAAAFLTANEVA